MFTGSFNSDGTLESIIRTKSNLSCENIICKNISCGKLSCNSIENIKHGKKTIYVENSSSPFKYYISFPSEFASSYYDKPNVIITIMDENPNVASLSVDNITQEGFDLYAQGTTSAYLTVQWIAISDREKQKKAD